VVPEGTRNCARKSHRFGDLRAWGTPLADIVQMTTLLLGFDISVSAESSQHSRGLRTCQNHINIPRNADFAWDADSRCGSWEIGMLWLVKVFALKV